MENEKSLENEKGGGEGKARIIYTLKIFGDAFSKIFFNLKIRVNSEIHAALANKLLNTFRERCRIKFWQSGRGSTINTYFIFHVNMIRPEMHIRK